MLPVVMTLTGPPMIRRLVRLVLPCVFLATLAGCGHKGPTGPVPGPTDAPPYLGDWKAFTGRAEFADVRSLVVLGSGVYLAHDEGERRVLRIGPTGLRLGSWPTVTDSSQGAPAQLSNMRLGQDGLLYFVEELCTTRPEASPADLPIPIPAGRCRSSIVGLSPEGEFRRRLPIFADDSLHVRSPYRDYEVNAAGELYALDYEGDTGPRVLKFDTAGEPLLRWGTRGAGDGEFERPSEIGLAPDGSVLVADDELYRLQRFDGAGRFLGRVLDEGDGYRTVDFNRFQIDAEGTIYFRGGGPELRRFSLEGIPLDPLTLRRPGSSGGDYYMEDFRGLAVDPSGGILLAASSGTLLHFTAGGDLDYQLGESPVMGASDFNYIGALAPAPGGGALGLTGSPPRLMRFGPDGSITTLFVAAEVGHGPDVSALTTDAQGRIYLLDARGRALNELLPDGSLRHVLSFPLALADVVERADAIVAAPDGLFYLAMWNYDPHIVCATAAGELRGQVAGTGDADSPLRQLRAIAVGPLGTLWALDAGVRYEVVNGEFEYSRRPRLASFSPTGTPLASIPLDSAAVGVVLDPLDLTFDAEGHFVVSGTSEAGGVILVLDDGGNLVARWGPGLTGDAAFQSPELIAVDAANRTYIYDYRSRRLLRFGGTRGGAAAGRIGS